MDKEVIRSISKQSERVTAAIQDLKQNNEDRNLDGLHNAVCELSMLLERLVLVIEAASK